MGAMTTVAADVAVPPDLCPHAARATGVHPCSGVRLVVVEVQQRRAKDGADCGSPPLLWSSAGFGGGAAAEVDFTLLWSGSRGAAAGGRS